MNATFQSYGDKSSAKRGFGRTFKDFGGDLEDYVGKNADGKWGFYVYTDAEGGKFYRDMDQSMMDNEAEQRATEAGVLPTEEEAAALEHGSLAAAIEKGIAEGESEHTEEGAPEKPSALGAFAFAQLTAPSGATTETEPEKETSGLKIEKNRAEQNGVKRPSAGTICAQVWEKAQSMTEKLGHTVTLSEIVAACETVGINKFTARTQYARWRAFNGIVGRAK